jgi:hypothetical protein
MGFLPDPIISKLDKLKVRPHFKYSPSPPYHSLLGDCPFLSAFVHFCQTIADIVRWLLGRRHYNMIIARVAWFLLASIAVATPTGDSLESPHISVVVSRRLHARGGDKQGSVSAKWNSNVELLSDIQIAGNNHSVVLDTGSADM